MNYNDDDFEVIERDFATPPLPKMAGVDHISSLEIFIKQLKQSLNKNDPMDRKIVSIEQGKEVYLENIIFGINGIDENYIIESVKNTINGVPTDLCSNFSDCANGDHYIKGRQHYLIAFTPDIGKDPHIRRDNRGVILGTTSNDTTSQRFLFPYDLYDLNNSISPDRMPKSTFVALVTPSLHLDRDGKIQHINWHLENTEHVDLVGDGVEVIEKLKLSLSASATHKLKPRTYS